MSTDIKYDGIEEVIESIESLAEVPEYQQKLAKACSLLVAEAVKKAPKGNGELRRSIKFKIDNTDDEIVGVVYSNLLYAPYVEYGTGLFAENGNGRKDVPWHYQDEEGNWHTTSGMPPSPYFRPALDENRNEILKILKEG